MEEIKQESTKNEQDYATKEIMKTLEYMGRAEQKAGTLWQGATVSVNTVSETGRGQQKGSQNENLGITR